MNVVDAGVIVELVAGRLDPDRLGAEDLAAAHLLHSEVTHVLRGLVLRGAITAEQAVVAMGGFAELAIVRYPADWLRPGMLDDGIGTTIEFTGWLELMSAFDTARARAPGHESRPDSPRAGR
ncbi:MAG: hypothetical protein QOE31_1187 [Solirubrobacteraceae bacterium]|nr:hypothetical protein [Solirubrobacteraceae bacterium]